MDVQEGVICGEIFNKNNRQNYKLKKMVIETEKSSYQLKFHSLSIEVEE